MGEKPRCGNCGGEIPADAPAGACPHCALAAALPPRPDPTPDEVAAKLPGFDILGVLGRGGMGVVFKARQKALDRVVALKVLPPATAATPGFSERFVREAKAMARLTHPNIVAVHDFGEAGGLFYLVLEFVDGMNVREAMRAGRIGPAEALAIVPQICDALQYAHDRGVVHRDIKPENVMIDRDGRVRIADFGLAKLADREAGDLSLTGASQVMGTLHYMAPEQWERPKEVDHRCDIYSLGVVFYEMLTGELPVGRFEPPSKKSHLDVRVDQVVLRSLERDRELRWQRADEMKTGVSAISSSSAPAAAAAIAAPVSAWDADDSVPSEEDVVHIGLAAVILGALTVIAAVAAFVSDMGWMWWLVAGAAFAAVACGATWFAFRRRRDAAGPAAAKRADDRERQREEEAQEATFTNAASTWLVAIAFAVAAFATDEAGLWWPCGAVAVGAAVVTVQAFEKRAKLAATAPPVAASAASAATWLSPVMCGVAASAAVVLLACMFWGVHTHSFEVGNGAGSLALVLGIVLVILLAVRRHQANAAEKTGRGPLGPPVMVGVASASSFALGVFCLLYALLGNRPAAPAVVYLPPEATSKRSEDRPPWDFEIEVPANEDPAHKPGADDRQGIWRIWQKAQSLQGGEFSDAFQDLYPGDDFPVFRSLDAAQREKAMAELSLGPPLIPKETALLKSFRIDHVWLGGWSENHFTAASVRATDGSRTLRFSMRFSPPGGRNLPIWCFVVAPLELK